MGRSMFLLTSQLFQEQGEPQTAPVWEASSCNAQQVSKNCGISPSLRCFQEQVKGTNLPSINILRCHSLAHYETSASHYFPQPQHVLSHFKRFPQFWLSRLCSCWNASEAGCLVTLFHSVLKKGVTHTGNAAGVFRSSWQLCCIAASVSHSASNYILRKNKFIYLCHKHMLWMLPT